MNSDGDMIGAYVAGLLTVIVVLTGFWHAAESGCQEGYDVFDCEWSQSPFTPVAPSDEG